MFFISYLFYNYIVCVLYILNNYMIIWVYTAIMYLEP